MLNGVSLFHCFPFSTFLLWSHFSFGSSISPAEASRHSLSPSSQYKNPFSDTFPRSTFTNNHPRTFHNIRLPLKWNVALSFALLGRMAARGTFVCACARVCVYVCVCKKADKTLKNNRWSSPEGKLDVKRVPSSWSRTRIASDTLKKSQIDREPSRIGGNEFRFVLLSALRKLTHCFGARVIVPVPILAGVVEAGRNTLFTFTSEGSFGAVLNNRNVAKSNSENFAQKNHSAGVEAFFFQHSKRWKRHTLYTALLYLCDSFQVSPTDNFNPTKIKTLNCEPLLKFGVIWKRSRNNYDILLTLNVRKYKMLLLKKWRFPSYIFMFLVQVVTKGKLEL